jgi:hypothetical protein
VPELIKAAEAFQDVRAVGGARLGSAPPEVIREAAGRLARPDPLDSIESGAVLGRLLWAADAALADALLETVYLATLSGMGTTDESLVRLVKLHDLGFDLENRAQRLELSWKFPEGAGGEGVPLHLEGSMFALDKSLARFSPRRLSDEPPLHPPTISRNLQTAFTTAVMLMIPFDLADEDRDLVVRALARGRERLTEAGQDPAALDRLADEARLSEWRRYQLPWIVQNEPAELARAFSRLDLFWLGRPALEGRNIDAWGTSAVGGCLCTRMPRPEPWEDFSGRPMSGDVASRMPDLTFRVAEALTAHKLPAFLTRDVLAVATTDLIEGVQPAYDDDWSSLVRYVGRLSDERMEDYISSVAAQGPLVSVPGGSRN